MRQKLRRTHNKQKKVYNYLVHYHLCGLQTAVVSRLPINTLLWNKLNMCPTAAKLIYEKDDPQRVQIIVNSDSDSEHCTSWQR